MILFISIQSNASDEEFMAFIYDSDFQTVKGIIARRIGDQWEAEDLAQKTMENLSRCIAKIRSMPEAEQHYYISSTAMNVVRNYYRDKGREEGDYTVESVESFDGIMDDNDPLNLIIDSEDTDILKSEVGKALKKLSDKSRRLLFDKYIRGISAAEIVRESGGEYKDEDYVYVATSRALVQLRKILRQSERLQEVVEWA